MQKGELEKSEDYFRRSLSIDPQQPYTKALLANVLSNQKNYQEALNLLIEASDKLQKPTLYIAIATLAAKVENFSLVKKYLELGAVNNKVYSGFDEFLRILSHCEIVSSGDDYTDAISCFEMGDNIVQLLHEINPSVKVK
jgi:tetratricopeptide (TPR) repeat protein